MVLIDLVEQIPLPAIILDQEGKILSFNEKMETNIEQPLVKGTSIKETFPTWDVKPTSKLILAEDRKKRYVFIKSSTKEDETHLFVGTETSELSALKNENEELKRLTRELDAIIENSYDGIYITDHKGVTWKTNSAIERITGIPKEYYIGKSVDALIKRGILKNSVTHRVVKQRRIVSLVQENYEGKETLITGAPVFNEEGAVEKVVTNIRDLSDLNELQTKLSRMNQLNDKYKKELDLLKNRTSRLGGLVIQSEPMKRIYDTAERIAHVNATVLILGETGVGKDILAKHIFKESARSSEGEFIKINCGAIPDDLLESELFGYEQGAFTGASQKGKPGMFEMADKGVLFLDEIGELPLLLQVKLLRVLQENEIQRIGGTKPRKVDVRIIAATNRDLKEMVEQGKFREDLYYRLNVLPISIPPLKDRRDDILPLMEMFLKQANEKYDMSKRIDSKVNDFFFSYKWPGNIREMSNLIERLVVTTPEDIIRMENLPPEYQDTTDVDLMPSSILPLKEAAELAEEKVLKLAVEKYKNTYDIAKAIETSQPTVVRKLRKYHLRIPRGGVIE
ncbi:sigma-54 interaction domain-containing protein [Halobacillus karajensis]|uniref:(S)-limonene 6-monooxygenase n=1 Tax=Halobacillus karajensis TaxID=195088 RepID=A0A024P430_9BACI|nr:sigma 54-interacting transcriptional regulator [Halobacillus karajensis]CDQ19046.1 (S)-limonene 6-monooxygenase [Halobacillus karajensis]CDQ22880.1 (S)-limonene 6-monooxygenase [Halobacillus karajensis]CDQ26362.1 (S)-limonene 6-monooxygenase [Halobacillus karajensis]